MGNGFFNWNGNVYESDIIKAAIRPTASAVGKAVAKHIREGKNGYKVNPEAYMRFLLREPNPIMSGQVLQEKMAIHLELNNNAFAYIMRDEFGYPTAIYPLLSSHVEALQNKAGELFLKFTMRNGKSYTFRYMDVIHIRRDFNNNEIFGDSTHQSLTPLMEIVNTTDQGIVKAIKNSNIVRWLLRFNQSLRPEDIRENTKQFVKDYLSTESELVGAAGTDAKADITQVEPKDYVPNENQMNTTTERIYSFFNTNKKIVQSQYTEDEWIAYYEAKVEPIITQLSNEFTRKLFTRKERGFGNEIIFESAALTFASMQTKLSLTQLVDRRIMSPNEVRKALNMAPVEGGDEMLQRLDTATVGKGVKEDNEEN